MRSRIIGTCVDLFGVGDHRETEIRSSFSVFSTVSKKTLRGRFSAPSGGWLRAIDRPEISSTREISTLATRSSAWTMRGHIECREAEPTDNCVSNLLGRVNGHGADSSTRRRHDILIEISHTGFCENSLQPRFWGRASVENRRR